jgi:hypothetical protein
MVRCSAESVRKSLRLFATVSLGVALTTIATYLIGVHNQRLVEVAMETVIHFIAHAILGVAATPLSAASPRVAARASLHLGSRAMPVAANAYFAVTALMNARARSFAGPGDFGPASPCTGSICNATNVGPSSMRIL